MSASIESTFVFNHPSLDARRETEREQDAAAPTRDGERRPAAQSPTEAQAAPGDGAYIADWVI